MLPNLLVIGAAKCGTTSLHEYLDIHPEISMSREKELDFFVPEKSAGRDREWYESQFDADAPVRGESSVSYTLYPDLPGVPERIHALIPDARLVYLVRDPIDRLVSHYLFRLLDHPEMGSLEQALEDPTLGAGLITIGRYWLQLEQYLGVFSAQQILVVDSDELRSQRDETLARIFEFVGVDPGFRSPRFVAEHNTGRPVRRTRLGLQLLQTTARVLGPERAHRVVMALPAAAKAPFRRRIEPPLVEPELREHLVEIFQPEVERLRSHTGLAFAGWSL